MKTFATRFETAVCAALAMSVVTTMALLLNAVFNTQIVA